MPDSNKTNEEQDMLLVVSSAFSRLEISRATVRVRVTPKRYRVLSKGSCYNELFSREGKRLNSGRHLSPYRFRLEAITALEKTP
jgi:hypothetical protein